MTSWDNQAVVTQVSAQVAREIATWYGDGAALLAALPDQRARTWSFFMRYGVRLADGTLTGLLVKIPREPGIATLEGAVAAEHLRPLAQQEYETLLAIAAAFEGSTSDSYCSVRPLAYLPEWNAIVMEELPAEPLKAIILRGRMMLNRDRDWVAVEQALVRAGTWLRLFHERVGALKHEPFPAEEYERKIGRTLQRLDRAVAGQLDLRALRAALDLALELARAASVPTATLHGDLTCANILVTRDSRVSVLDSNSRARGPVVADLAGPIADLATRKIQVLTFGSFIRKERLDRCRAALLMGYFDGDSSDTPALDLACALSVTVKWAADEAALAEARGAWRLFAHLFTPVMRRYFTRLIHGHLASGQSPRHSGSPRHDEPSGEALTPTRITS